MLLARAMDPREGERAMHMSGTACDTGGLDLGDFASLWAYLDATRTRFPAAFAYDSEKETIRKATRRASKKAKRRAKHEAQEKEQKSISSLDLLQSTSASDTEGMINSENDTSREDRLSQLRSTLESMTLEHKASSPKTRHAPKESAIRIQSLSNKLDKLISPSTGSHIFVDSSNIYLGFQRYLQSEYPDTYPPYSQRKKPFMDLSALDRILKRETTTVTKVLVGSSPVLQSWSAAKALGYEVSILERVAKVRETAPSNSPPQIRKAEQGVDELLHMKMLESILDSPPSHMVLASGDANIAEYSKGFYSVALKALARGWTVDVVAFCEGLNRLWENDTFRHQWGSAFNIIYLDDYIDELEA